MKANELRIGNWIECKFGNTQIHCIDTESVEYDTFAEYIKDIKPIPLTEQWLLDFGFDKMNTEYSKGYYFYNDETLRIDHGNECYFDIPCKYVHTLQNLYFALTGEELIYLKCTDSDK